MRLKYPAHLLSAHNEMEVWFRMCQDIFWMKIGVICRFLLIYSMQQDAIYRQKKEYSVKTRYFINDLLYT